MTPTEFRAIRRAVVDHLRGCPIGAGQGIAALRLAIPSSSGPEIEKALEGLRADGLVSYAESLGPDGISDIELTAAGLDHDPAERRPDHVPVIAVHGGAVQIGNHNRQDMRGPRRRGSP